MNHLAWIALILFSINIAVSAEETSSSESLRVITYNIHHAEGIDATLDVNRIVEVVRTSGAQVVCLQEVDRGMTRTGGRDLPKELAQLLGMNVVFEPNLIVPPNGHYGNATLTSLEIIAHENIALPNPHNVEPRGCLRVRVRWGRGELDIINTHLGLKPDERLAQAERIDQFLKQLKESNPGGAILLAGDLNEPSTEPGLRVLLASLSDSSLVLGESERNTIPVKKPIRQIDFILHSKSLTPTSARVIRDEVTAIASDHLPYVCEFAWRD